MKNKTDKIDNTQKCADAKASSACIVIPPALPEDNELGWKNNFEYLKKISNNIEYDHSSLDPISLEIIDDIITAMKKLAI